MEETRRRIDKKKATLVILVGLLLVMTVVQTFQIDGLQKDLKEDGNLKVNVQGGQSSSGSTPTATRSAPSMVGGC